MIPSKQGYGNSRETVLRGETLIISISITEHLVDCNHSCQSTRNGHREHNLLLDGDASVFGRARILTCGADFVSPLRAPEKDIHERASGKRENKSDVQRNAQRKSGNDLTKTGYVSGTADGKSFKNWIALLFEICLSQSAGHSNGYEVHHDGIDDFMRPETSLQDAGNGRPHSPAENGNQAREWN